MSFRNDDNKLPTHSALRLEAVTLAGEEQNDGLVRVASCSASPDQREQSIEVPDNARAGHQQRERRDNTEHDPEHLDMLAEPQWEGGLVATLLSRRHP